MKHDTELKQLSSEEIELVAGGGYGSRSPADAEETRGIIRGFVGLSPLEIADLLRTGNGGGPRPAAQ